MEIFVSKSQKAKYYRRLRIKIYFYLGFLIFFGILSVYGVNNLSFFKIKKFEVSGSAKLEELTAEILKTQPAQFLGFKNFLSWPSELGNIKIEKDYLSGTLKLNGASPERFAIWCSKDCYWIGRNGISNETAPDTEGGSIPKINDGRSVILVSGKEILSEADWIENIVKIIDGVSDLPIRIKEYDFNERLEELTANAAAGQKLIFSVRFAPSIKAFAYLKDLISKGKLKSSEYVDLTVENRIYLKTF